MDRATGKVTPFLALGSRASLLVTCSALALRRDRLPLVPRAGAGGWCDMTGLGLAQAANRHHYRLLVSAAVEAGGMAFRDGLVRLRNAGWRGPAANPLARL